MNARTTSPVAAAEAAAARLIAEAQVEETMRETVALFVTVGVSEADRYRMTELVATLREAGVKGQTIADRITMGYAAAGVAETISPAGVSNHGKAWEFVNESILVPVERQALVIRVFKALNGSAFKAADLAAVKSAAATIEDDDERAAFIDAALTPGNREAVVDAVKATTTETVTADETGDGPAADSLAVPSNARVKPSTVADAMIGLALVAATLTDAERSELTEAATMLLSALADVNPIIVEAQEADRRTALAAA